MKTETKNNEHFEKYESLYLMKGSFINNLVPFTKEEIENALNNGDEHLNSLPLRRWDAAAYSVGWTSETDDGKKFESLAEQVCLLKHAARHHIAFK